MCRIFIVCLLFLLLTFGHPDISGEDCACTNRFNPATSYIRICACSKPDLDVHCSVVFVFCVSWVMGFVGEFVGGKSHCIIYNSQFKHCFLDSTSV
jgi:hypothetical protein